jgi:hypothetical protein
MTTLTAHYRVHIGTAEHYDSDTHQISVELDDRRVVAGDVHRIVGSLVLVERTAHGVCLSYDDAVQRVADLIRAATLKHGESTVAMFDIEAERGGRVFCDRWMRSADALALLPLDVCVPS